MHRQGIETPVPTLRVMTGTHGGLAPGHREWKFRKNFGDMRPGGTQKRARRVTIMNPGESDIGEFRSAVAGNDAAVRRGPLGDGRRIAAERTAIHDRVVRDWAAELGEQTGYARPYGLVAVGGTGRQEVCPCSDLDYVVLVDDAFDDNPLLAEIERQTVDGGEFGRRFGFEFEPLAFNLDSVTSFDDARQLNSFLDMRAIHDPDDLSTRFRERIRESFDPFAHLLHLRGFWREKWERAAGEVERLDEFDIKNEGLRVLLAAVWLLAGREFRHSHEIYATLDPRVMEAYGVLLRVRQFVHLRRRDAGIRPVPLPDGRHAEDVLGFDDFVSFGDMLGDGADERERFEFSDEVRARLLAARRQLAVFAKGVIGEELRVGRPVAAGNPLVFGSGGLRSTQSRDGMSEREKSRSALALLAAAQRYDVPIDPSELQGAFLDAGEWLEPVPELGYLFYEPGSLAGSFQFLSQIPGAEGRLFPGYGRFEASLDPRVMAERKSLRGALANAKIHVLEDWVAAGRRRLDEAVSDSRLRDLEREGVSVTIEAAQLDPDHLAAVKLALKTKRLPVTADDAEAGGDTTRPLHERFASGVSGIRLDDYYQPYGEWCRLPAAMIELTTFLVGQRRAFKRLAEVGLSDAGLVGSLAELCGDEQRLRSLFVFTCADRCEWESEKEEPARWFSIRELYYKTMLCFRPSSAGSRLLREAGLAEDDMAVLQGFGGGLAGGAYWRHAMRFVSHLLRLASDPACEEPKTAIFRDGASVILGVVSRDFRGLAAVITGALWRMGVGLHQAHLFTSAEQGLALDFFHLAGDVASPGELANQVGEAIRQRSFISDESESDRVHVGEGELSLEEWRPGLYCLRVETPLDGLSGETGLVHSLALGVYRQLHGAVHAMKVHSSRGRAYAAVYHTIPAGMPVAEARDIVAGWR